MITDDEGRSERHVVLLWSARYDVENGQAIVTRRVVEQQTSVCWIKAIYKPGGGLSAVSAVAAALRALWVVLVIRPETVYVVCARSTLGFCRDLPVLLTSLLGYRVVVHVHGSDLPDLLRQPFLGCLAKAIYRRCEIIVPSAHLIQNLHALSCEKVVLCENFRWDTDAPIVPPIFRRDGISLLWNSNLMASKGIRECVAGIRLSRSRGAKVRLTVLGRPISDVEASAAEMKKYAHSLSAEDWIEVLGPVSSDKAQALVEEHHAIMLPSRYSSECQPLAIIEAMAAAREIVISDTPALRTTVGDYPALVVDGSVEAIAAAIEIISASSPGRPQALKNGAVAARKRFSPERFDREMRAILSSVPPTDINKAKIEQHHSKG